MFGAKFTPWIHHEIQLKFNDSECFQSRKLFWTNKLWIIEFLMMSWEKQRSIFFCVILKDHDFCSKFQKPGPYSAVRSFWKGDIPMHFIFQFSAKFNALLTLSFPIWQYKKNVSTIKIWPKNNFSGWLKIELFWNDFQFKQAIFLIVTFWDFL